MIEHDLLGLRRVVRVHLVDLGRGLGRDVARRWAPSSIRIVVAVPLEDAARSW